MIRHVATAFALSSLIALPACLSGGSIPQTGNSEPQPRRATFFPKEYEPYGYTGTSVITGQAFLVMANGERQYCSRQAVFMNPVTTYSFEWYTRNVIDRIELEPSDPRAADYHWVDRADSLGRFRFERLPAGEYYIGCRVLPEEGFAHAEVEVGQGDTVEVFVTREVEGAGVSAPTTQDEATVTIAENQEAEHPFGQLNSEAPPETAQWGRLAGVWDCTMRSVAADGSVQEGKATWTWAYVIDGYAVQDVYVGHRTDGRRPFYGSGIREYNPAEKRWEITWMDNNSSLTDRRVMRTYTATYENEQIVMRKDGDRSWRVVFFNMRDDSFEWREDSSQQTQRCERIAGSRHQQP